MRPSIALGQVVDVSAGQPAPKASELSDYGIPFIRAASLESLLNGGIEADCEKISEDKAKKNRLRLYPKDTILFAKSGMSATLGRVYRLKQPAYVVSHLAALAPMGAYDPAFLTHWLRQNSPAHLIKDEAYPSIRVSDIEQLEVPRLELIEQRRIAAILDKADGIRRKREQTLALADEFLRSAFVHLVGFKHPHFTDWKPRKIEDLAVPHQGAMRTGPFGSDLRHSEFVDQGIAVLGIDNAVQNRFAWGERRYITEEKYEKLKRYRVFPGDVIITIMGTTGRSAVIPQDIPAAITTKHLAAITCDTSKIVPEFLSFAIYSDPSLSRQIRKANKGAIMDGLNLGIIKALEINLPPYGDQQKFAELHQMINSFKERASMPVRGGHDLFGSLSQRAFRGEL